MDSYSTFPTTVNSSFGNQQQICASGSATCEQSSGFSMSSSMLWAGQPSNISQQFLGSLSGLPINATTQPELQYGTGSQQFQQSTDISSAFYSLTNNAPGCYSNASNNNSAFFHTGNAFIGSYDSDYQTFDSYSSGTGGLSSFGFQVASVPDPMQGNCSVGSNMGYQGSYAGVQCHNASSQGSGTAIPDSNTGVQFNMSFQSKDTGFQCDSTSVQSCSTNIQANDIIGLQGDAAIQGTATTFQNNNGYLQANDTAFQVNNVGYQCSTMGFQDSDTAFLDSGTSLQSNNTSFPVSNDFFYGGNVSSQDNSTDAGFQHSNTSLYLDNAGFLDSNVGFQGNNFGFYANNAGFMNSNSGSQNNNPGFKNSSTAFPGDNTGFQYTNAGYQNNNAGYQNNNPGFMNSSTAFPGDNTGLQYTNAGYQNNNPGFMNSSTAFPGDNTGLQYTNAGYQNNNAGYQNNNAGCQNNNAGYQDNNTGFQNNNPGFKNSSIAFPGDNTGFQDTTAGYQNNNTGFQNNNPGFNNCNTSVHVGSTGFQAGNTGFQGASTGLQTGNTGYQGPSTGLHAGNTGFQSNKTFFQTNNTGLQHFNNHSVLPLGSKNSINQQANNTSAYQDGNKHASHTGTSKSTFSTQVSQSFSQKGNFGCDFHQSLSNFSKFRQTNSSDYQTRSICGAQKDDGVKIQPFSDQSAKLHSQPSCVSGSGIYQNYSTINSASQYLGSRPRFSQSGNCALKPAQGDANFTVQHGLRAGLGSFNKRNINSSYADCPGSYSQKPNSGYAIINQGMKDKSRSFFGSTDYMSETTHPLNYMPFLQSHPQKMFKGKFSLTKNGNKAGPTQKAASSSDVRSLLKYPTAKENKGKKPSDEFADEDTDYCRLCNIYFTSRQMYAFHVRGLTHVQRMIAVDEGKDRKPSEKPFIISGSTFTQTAMPGSGKPDKISSDKEDNKENMVDSELRKQLESDVKSGCLVSDYCDVCETRVDSAVTLWRHLSSSRHTKNLKSLKCGGQREFGRDLETYPLKWSKKPQTLDDSGGNVDCKDGKGKVTLHERVSDIEFSLRSLHPKDPVLGLEYVVETIVNRSQVFLCELCEMQGSKEVMANHIIGLKHQLAYLKLNDMGKHNTVINTRKVDQKDAARTVCLEFEQGEGRRRPRYRKPQMISTLWARRKVFVADETLPPPHQRVVWKEQKPMSKTETEHAMNVLKRALMEDFERRCIPPDIAEEMLNSRMSLLGEYEQNGVPFVVASERIIEEEERWNLLLEFERQSLPFEESEQRIDHRYELMKMYEKLGFLVDEARAKLLEDEVIHDFKNEFVKIGLSRYLSRKLAERRLWMLEHLHIQKFTPEEASIRVLDIEHELNKFLSLMMEEKAEEFEPTVMVERWMKINKEIEDYIMLSGRALDLTRRQKELQLKFVYEALEQHKATDILPYAAVFQVLVVDLPDPTKMLEEHLLKENPGSKADIVHRIEQFDLRLKSIFHSTGNANSKKKSVNNTSVEAEQGEDVLLSCLLEDYDKQVSSDIQTLFTDMLNTTVTFRDAMYRLNNYFNEHEDVRQMLLSKKILVIPVPEQDMLLTDSVADDQGANGRCVTFGNGEVSLEKSTSGDVQIDENVEHDKEVTFLVKNVDTNTQEVVSSETKAIPATSDIGHVSENKAQDQNNMQTSSSSDDRWNAAVEMLLDVYKANRAEFNAEILERRLPRNHEQRGLSPRNSHHAIGRHGKHEPCSIPSDQRSRLTCYMSSQRCHGSTQYRLSRSSTELPSMWGGPTPQSHSLEWENSECQGSFPHHNAYFDSPYHTDFPDRMTCDMMDIEASRFYDGRRTPPEFRYGHFPEESFELDVPPYFGQPHFEDDGDIFSNYKRKMALHDDPSQRPWKALRQPGTYTWI